MSTSRYGYPRDPRDALESLRHREDALDRWERDLRTREDALSRETGRGDPTIRRSNFRRKKRVHKEEKDYAKLAAPRNTPPGPDDSTTNVPSC